MSNTTNFGFKKVAIEDKANLVADVFHSVAKNYDLMNDVMSCGLHRIWKQFTLCTSNIRSNAKVLDIAGGTGDMAIKFKQRLGESSEVWHTDINSSMLKYGRDRMINHGILTLECICDAEHLPFNTNYFDVVCVAFGLRNMTNKQAALKEMYRVLSPGGMLLILEFSKILPLLSKLYDIYTFNIVPKLGKILVNDSQSYTYLAESIKLHPNQIELQQIISDAGFAMVKYYNLSLGICALHKSHKI